MKLLPTLALHFDVVVIDRWNVSTLVYGTEAGVPVETTECILKGIVEPDLVFVFDGEQFDAPDADDAYEADKPFQARLRTGFSNWADAHPDITMKVNANRDKHLICEDLMEAIRNLVR